MSEVLVIGGGLIGMLTALELARSGQPVRILERGETGRESSWAGGGILSPLYPWRYPEPVTLLARWGQERYHELARQLTEDTGISPEWTCSGMLALGIDAQERDEAVSWAFQYDYELEYVEGAGLQRIEPALGVSEGGAIWMPNVAQMRNPRLLRAVRYAAEAEGVQITEQCEVASFSMSEGGVLQGVVTTTGETIKAEKAVVAGSAWSANLLATTGIHLPIEPVRGQMLLYRATPQLLTRIVLSDGHYVIPRRDGRILVGSTLERVGFEKITTVQGHTELVAAAHHLVPALKQFPIEKQWAGLRPGSPDGVPFIGQHPEISGLYVNAGHFRNGVVIGLASARLAADIVMQREPILPLAPYAPAAH